MKSFTKTALSAAFILGTASAAFAFGVPEARVSGVQAPVTMTTVGHFSGNVHEVPESRVSGIQSASTRVAAYRQTATANQSADDAEFRISDRYPGLGMNAYAKVSTVRHVAIADQSADNAEFRIGDRYPALAHVNSTAGAKDAGVNRVAYAGPENQMGDRYAPVALKSVAYRTASNVNRVAYEGPENQITDKFPLLARTGTQRGMASLITTNRSQKHAQKLTAKNKA